MSDQHLNVALIHGSSREGRFCDTVMRWVREQVDAQSDFSARVVDPRSLASPACGREAVRRTLHAADAFIVVTPEYNHGYPAALKELIDAFGAEWHAKPVAFVSYGGVSGGLRAVEQLRLVFAELHAVTVRDSVSFANAYEQFDGEGRLVGGGRHERAMGSLLAALRWWGAVLRHGRDVAPYESRAA